MKNNTINIIDVSSYSTGGVIALSPLLYDTYILKGVVTLTSALNLAVSSVVDGDSFFIINASTINLGTGSFSILGKNIDATLLNGISEIFCIYKQGVWTIIPKGDDTRANRIDTNAIQDGAVTASKLANNSVTTPKIIDGAVVLSKIANQADQTVLANISGSSSAPQAVAVNTLVGSIAWSQLGNSGTTPGTQFIGTTDAVDFVTKTAAVERGRVTALGTYLIGSPSVQDNTNKLEVTGNIRTTALQLTTGAAAGYKATSDANGNFSWVAADTFGDLTEGGSLGVFTFTGNTGSVRGSGVTITPKLNSITQAGVVPAPTVSNANKVWKADGSGNPNWLSENTSVSYLAIPTIVINTDNATAGATSNVLVTIVGDLVRYDFNVNLVAVAGSDTHIDISMTTFDNIFSSSFITGKIAVSSTAESGVIEYINSTTIKLFVPSISATGNYYLACSVSFRKS